MAEDKNTSQVNMKIPGMKGGPRNRGAAVEKPVNGKETFMRLMQYFAKEIPVIIALFIAVVVMVVCSVYAPKLQSQAIDYISLRKFNNLNHILGGIHNIQYMYIYTDKTKCHIKPENCKAYETGSF